MDTFPADPKKIRAKISSYKRKLQKEKEEFGFISDGYGKRFLIGTLYLLSGDLPGALEYYQWYEKEFPDCSGEPLHDLSWALALFLSGDRPQARKHLIDALFLNLHIASLVLQTSDPYPDFYHGGCSGLYYIEGDLYTDAVERLWNEKAVEWFKSIYFEKRVQDGIKQFIEYWEAWERREKVDHDGMKSLLTGLKFE